MGGVIRSTMASPTAMTRATRRAISRLPESLTFQLFDDETIVRGSTALRTEQAPVRVPDGIGTFPPAETAQGISRRHRAPQKKSSSVSFFSDLRGPSEGSSAPEKSSLSKDLCWAGCVPVKRAFSSQP